MRDLMWGCGGTRGEGELTKAPRIGSFAESICFAKKSSQTPGWSLDDEGFSLIISFFLKYNYIKNNPQTSRTFDPIFCLFCISVSLPYLFSFF